MKVFERLYCERLGSKHRFLGFVVIWTFCWLTHMVLIPVVPIPFPVFAFLCLVGWWFALPFSSSKYRPGWEWILGPLWMIEALIPASWDPMSHRRLTDIQQVANDSLERLNLLPVPSEMSEVLLDLVSSIRDRASEAGAAVRVQKLRDARSGLLGHGGATEELFRRRVTLRDIAFLRDTLVEAVSPLHEGIERLLETRTTDSEKGLERYHFRGLRLWRWDPIEKLWVKKDLSELYPEYHTLSVPELLSKFDRDFVRTKTQEEEGDFVSSMQDLERHLHRLQKGRAHSRVSRLFESRWPSAVRRRGLLRQYPTR